MERLETDLIKDAIRRCMPSIIFFSSMITFTINVPEQSTDKRSSERSEQRKNNHWTEGLKRTVNYVASQSVKERNREGKNLKTAQGNLPEQRSPSQE